MKESWVVIATLFVGIVGFFVESIYLNLFVNRLNFGGNIGREFIFPDNIKSQRLVMDDTLVELYDNTYSVVVYLDSTNCIPCKLSLPKWEEFVNQYDSCQELNFICAVRVTDEREIAILQKQQRSRLPIYMDKNGFIESNNHIDAGDVNVFLLDTNNRIIAIGDPLTNLMIEKIYDKHLK